ncbi:MAG TPA: carboxypeptidase regulatory-like domain-containing protein [Candidatus Saccharimonadales bacterium]|jgi:virginiamycin B lyase|nr:carboxypeptidase regulatory-like domain-containing protein [Candidatus Saccharimonadales bacterium]
MHRIQKLFAFIGATIFLAALVHGATISGTVKGPDGVPFKGAFVSAQNTKTKITVNVLSHKDGAYRVDDLPAGEYVLRIRAVGYQADPRTGVALTTNQSASMDWALKAGPVRWRDLSLYQGEKLIPNIRGKEMVFGPLANFRDAPCQICHGFQTRMAAISRDSDGAKDRVDYMRTRMHFLLGTMVNDEQADKVASFISTAFGPESVLPKSPADLPEYKNTVRTFDDDAMNIVYVEYDLPGPNRMPWSAAPDKEGNIWMPYYGGANRIGKLDPETGDVKEYDVPNENAVAIHSAYPAADGSIWLAEFGLNRLGKFDPKTQKLSEFADAYTPGKEGLVAGGSKHTVRVGPHGVACASGTRVSRYDPKTGKFTDFNEPAYGVVVDKDSNCWFSEYNAVGKIGKIDGKTLEIKTWDPPGSNTVYSRRIQIDSDGIVWFSQSGAGQIGRFDPKTETFKNYALPGPNASPYAMNLDRNHDVWYSSEYLDEVGRLNTTTGNVTEYPFPHSEITSREYFLDAQGRMWYATPSNNKVGYFYVAGQGTIAKNSGK